MSFVDDFAEINKDLNKLEADKAPKQQEEFPLLLEGKLVEIVPSEILYVSPSTPQQWIWGPLNSGTTSSKDVVTFGSVFRSYSKFEHFVERCLADQKYQVDSWCGGER